MSIGCKSNHNGFLDVSCSNGGLRISGWIGQLSCLTIFSTSLSVAAFLCRAGAGRFNVGEHWKPWERCRTEGTRDETHGRVQLYIDPNFQWSWLNPGFKVMPLFDAEYLRNTVTVETTKDWHMPYWSVSFWMTLSDLAKYSMTRSITS